MDKNVSQYVQSDTKDLHATLIHTDTSIDDPQCDACRRGAAMVVGVTIVNACDISGPVHHSRHRGDPVVSCRFEQPFKVTDRTAAMEREDGTPSAGKGAAQRASAKFWMIEF